MTLKARSPRLDANFISKLLFCWMNPIFEKGAKRQLEEEDMFEIADDERSQELGDELEKAWFEEIGRNDKKAKEPSLILTLVWTFWKSYMLYGFLLVFEEAVNILQPYLLSRLIRYFIKDTVYVSETESYIYAGGVGFCAVILAITHHSYFLGVQMIALRMKIACSSLIYRQSLQLSSEAGRKTSTGQIIDLLSNDVRNFSQLMTKLHFLWVGPLEILVVIAILWTEIGPPAIAGFLVMISMIPLIHFFGNLTSKYKKSSARYRDKRLSIITEIVMAIKTVKLYCWETPFGEFLRKERRLEVGMQRKILGIHFVQDCLTFVSKFLYLLPLVIWMIYTSVDLRASKVFLALRIYEHTGFIVGREMYNAYTSYKETQVSLGRIQKFLLLGKKKPNTNEESGVYVDINIESAKWQRDSDKVTVKNVSARVEQGQVLTISGPVGCGKTSILMAIMNELPEVDGTISVGGRLAYASQQPWIFSGTVKENIISYNENKYNNERYEKVIHACALDKDLLDLPNGDETLIGDRGMDLSGGQKSRVNLARALYFDADIYLLDDPLSAVDTDTGQHIYRKAILGFLKEKAVILVTHQRQFLRYSDEVIFISKAGELVKRVDKEILQTLDDSEISELSPLDTESVDRNGSDDFSQLTMDQTSLQDNEQGLESSKNFKRMQPFSPERSAKEERRVKPVKLSTYFKYFSAGAHVITLGVLIIIFIATQGSYIFSDWWLSNWVTHEEDKYAAISEKLNLLTEDSVNSTGVQIPDVNTHFNLSILCYAVVAVIAFGLLRATLFFNVVLDASRNLHNEMFDSILATKIQFFKKYSVTGQIQNRFSKDVRLLDESLPKKFYEFLQSALLVLGTVVVAGMSVPWVYIILIPLFVVFVKLRSRYILTSSQIRRLESTTLSPVNGQATCTQDGIYTIRASNSEKNMIRLYDHYQNKHTQATSLSLTSDRWLAVRLDLLCAIFVITVSFACVAAADSLNAGSVGLSMTYAISLMTLFQWCVRQSAEVENQMVSVERVYEYVNLSPESTISNNPPSNWPEKGTISFRDVSLLYPQRDDPVLRNLSLTIGDREKVGIVGRTGAGKSSLVAMLFRLVEPEGVIMIDHMNIKEITLHALRKSMSIIPQEPALFAGSLRKNIDPFSECRDVDIWAALDEVQLKENVKRLPGGLDSEVTEAGSNFSVGQRQLICLARVILLRRKIVIFDEATANVDNQTDAKIQSVIRKKFIDCTVLTIAHRLQSVMDCDKILVMEDGKVMFDEPYVLLQNTECSLLKMVEEAGKLTASKLKNIAKTAWERKHEVQSYSDPEIVDCFITRM